MSESHAIMPSAIPSFGHFCQRSSDGFTGTLPREICPSSGSELPNGLIINNSMGLHDQRDVQNDQTHALPVSTPSADDDHAENSVGQKRPASVYLPGPDPIRQHLDKSHENSDDDLNSLSAHRARLVALLTYIHTYSGEIESRLNKKISSCLENTRHVVQKNKITVVTVQPTPTNKDQTTDVSNNSNSNANALEVLQEIQLAQMEIRYATMETHYKTQLEVVQTQYEESQRSIASLLSIATAALEQSRLCREELATFKVQMRTAHVNLLQDVASTIRGLKDELNTLKGDHDALAAQAIVTSRPAPPEVSATSDECQQLRERKIKTKDFCTFQPIIIVNNKGNYTI